MTYGSLVRQVSTAPPSPRCKAPPHARGRARCRAQLLNDSEDCVDDVNVQLDKLYALAQQRFRSPLCYALPQPACRRSGYNIGARLIDEYFAKTGGVRVSRAGVRIPTSVPQP